MIIGLLLGVSLAIFMTSGIFVVSGYSGLLRENLITGAVVGGETLASYSWVPLILSFIAILFLISILRKKIRS
ncbi:MAG: hypothetical protein WC494_01130 [Candidatus Pacearchaeota archaeon]